LKNVKKFMIIALVIITVSSLVGFGYFYYEANNRVKTLEAKIISQTERIETFENEIKAKTLQIETQKDQLGEQSAKLYCMTVQIQEYESALNNMAVDFETVNMIITGDGSF